MERVEPVAEKAGSLGPDGLTCPWCGSPEVERVGFYGPQLMGESYLCRWCHSPFERIRRRGEDGRG